MNYEVPFVINLKWLHVESIVFSQIVLEQKKFPFFNKIISTYPTSSKGSNTQNSYLQTNRLDIFLRVSLHDLLMFTTSLIFDAISL